MQKMPQSAGRKPFTPEQSVAGPMNQEAIISRLIGRVFTHTVVKVVAVDAGTTGPVGFVDVVNLLQQMDGNNNGIPNVPMYKLPYFRLQGGSNAVIIDPKVGDIGLASFAMGDISEIKRSKQEGPPPSRRAHDVSDGLYIGGFLNGAPSQYIHFLESGINMVATGKITATTPAEFEINASDINMVATGKITATAPAGVEVNGSLLQVNAPIIATGNITALSGPSSVSMEQMRTVYNSHTHNENDSSGPTDPPNQEM